MSPWMRIIKGACRAGIAASDAVRPEVWPNGGRCGPFGLWRGTARRGLMA